MIKKIIISASTHPCPFEKLGEYAKELQKNGVDYLHCDLMDGHFVQDTALSKERIVEIWKLCDLPLDVHLMAEKPIEYFDACLEANAEYVTIHFESFDKIEDLKQAITTLKNNGIKAGVSIKPNTKIKELLPILEYLDLVLIMSVEPGASGQEFLISSIERIAKLKKMREDNNYNFIIEVDGGINSSTAHLAVSAGADMLVSGSYLYKSQDKKIAISKLK